MEGSFGTVFHYISFSLVSLIAGWLIIFWWLLIWGPHTIFSMFNFSKHSLSKVKLMSANYSET